MMTQISQRAAEVPLKAIKRKISDLDVVSMPDE